MSLCAAIALTNGPHCLSYPRARRTSDAVCRAHSGNSQQNSNSIHAQIGAAPRGRSPFRIVVRPECSETAIASDRLDVAASASDLHSINQLLRVFHGQAPGCFKLDDALAAQFGNGATDCFDRDPDMICDVVARHWRF